MFNSVYSGAYWYRIQFILPFQRLTLLCLGNRLCALPVAMSAGRYGHRYDRQGLKNKPFHQNNLPLIVFYHQINEQQSFLHQQKNQVSSGHLDLIDKLLQNILKPVFRDQLSRAGLSPGLPFTYCPHVGEPEMSNSFKVIGVFIISCT